MFARAKEFFQRSKPLSAFRETRGLVAGSLTGIFFGLLNIFRVPPKAPIFGRIPVLFTSTMVILGSLFRVKKTLNEFESEELTAQQNEERELLIKGSAKVIYAEISKLDFSQKSKLFEETGISADDWNALTLSVGDTEKLNKALLKMYQASINHFEKYSFSLYCGLVHLFGHFSEAMQAQVFTDRFDLFDYPNFKEVQWDRILFWGLLMPFAVYNGYQTTLEIKESYDNPSQSYLRQQVLQRISQFKPKAIEVGDYQAEQSMQYVRL